MSFTVKQSNPTQSNEEVYSVFLEKQSKFDTTKFTHICGHVFRDYLVAMVEYDELDGFNSRKVLLWKGLSSEEYKLFTNMDPTFNLGSKLVGTFKPTKEVYNSVIHMIHRYQGDFRDIKEEYLMK